MGLRSSRVALRLAETAATLTLDSGKTGVPPGSHQLMSWRHDSPGRVLRACIAMHHQAVIVVPLLLE
jgi:hypothetical protein